MGEEFGYRDDPLCYKGLLGRFDISKVVFDGNMLMMKKGKKGKKEKWNKDKL